MSDEKQESYEWLLEVVLEAMGQKHPRSAITDGDRAMANTIKSTWPNIGHRLCIWHIEENMVTHLRKGKRDLFRQLIYRRWDPDEFERQWEHYKQIFQVKPKGKQDRWVRRMYKLRHKWSTFLYKA